MRKIGCQERTRCDALQAVAGTVLLTAVAPTSSLMPPSLGAGEFGVMVVQVPEAVDKEASAYYPSWDDSAQAF